MSANPNSTGQKSAWSGLHLETQFLIMLSFVGLLSLVAVGLPTLMLVERISAADARNRMEAAVVAAQAAVSLQLDLLLEQAQSLALSPLIRNAHLDVFVRDAYASVELQQRCEANPHLVQMALISFDGSIVAGCNKNYSGLDIDLSALSAQSAHLDTAISTIANRNNRPKQVVAVPVSHPPTGQVESSLVVVIDLESVVSAVYAKLPLPLAVLQPDGPLPAMEDEASRVYTYEPQNSLQSIEGAFPSFVLQVATREYLSEYSSKLGTYALGLLVLALAILVLAKLSAQRLTSAFTRLDTAARELQLDGMPPWPDDLGSVEANTLSRSFSSLIDELRKSRDQLQLRVAQRTREASLAKERLAIILDSIPDVVYSCDPEYRTEHYVSANLQRLLPASFSGKGTLGDLLRYVHPDDVGKVLEFRQSVATLGASEATYRVRTPKGTRWMHERARTCSEGGSRHIDGLISDATQRIEAEIESDRHRESLQLKNRALESSHNGIAIVSIGSGQDGRITYANPALGRILEMPPDQLLGMSPAEFARDEADIRRFRQVLSNAVPNREITLSAPLRLPGSGRCIWTAISLAPVIPSQGQEIEDLVAIVTDVTQQHHNASRLRLLETALQESHNGVVIANVMHPDQPILYVNRAFEQITGYSASEVIGRNCRMLQGKDNEQPAARQLKEAIAARRSISVLMRNYRKSGELFWNELSLSPVPDPESGVIKYYVGIQHDVTDRRVAEQQLIQAISNMDAVFTLSPDGVVTIGGDGTITHLNPAAEDLLGCASGDMTGQPLKQLMRYVAGLTANTATRKRLRRAFRLALERESLPVEFELIRPQFRILLLSIRRVGNGGHSMVCYLRDITREARLDRMKSDFLSTAAHELRTPMASILGFAELLLSRRDFDEALRDELLTTILRQAQRLTSLLNDLLDLARIESGQEEVFNMIETDLGELLTIVTRDFIMPGDDRRVQLEMDTPLPRVRLDRNKFEQALLNVLSNAFKYSPNGGEIVTRVTAHRHDAQPMIAIRVSDKGIGMTPEQAASAFERFYRADNTGDIAGTGLGLPLAREILRAHGGDVELVSVSGEGSTVTLWLPATGACSTRNSPRNVHP